MTTSRRPALARLALLLVAPAVLVPAIARAGEPAGAPNKVAVATTLVSNDAPTGPGASEDPTPHAAQAPKTIEFEEAVPQGATPLPGGLAATPLYGSLKLGATSTAFALVRTDKDKIDLYVDLDRDGRFDPEKEKQSYTGSPWKQGSIALGTEWKIPSATLGSTPILLTVKDRMADFSGVLALPTRSGEKPTQSPLQFSETQPATVQKAPQLPGKLLWATGKLGGKDVVVAAARGTGDDLQVVVDGAGTADLSAAKPFQMKGRPMRRGTRRVGTTWSDPVEAAGVTARLQVIDSTPNVFAQANAQGTRRGTVDVDGTAHSLYLVDGDFDGAFTGVEDAWWFGPSSTNSRPSANNMFEGDSTCLGSGESGWRLVSVAPDGSARILRLEKVGDLEDYFRRRSERVNASRWFPAFAADEGFAKQNELDLSRPRAETPAEIHFTRDLKSALTLAAQEGKPLLVDFEADWCVWCKRLDYYTYPDAEVAKRLKGFTVVKINKDFDAKKSFEEMKDPRGNPWSGIPALAVFGSDGKPVTFRMPSAGGKPGPVVNLISGWSKPEVFVRVLDAALAGYQDAKAGRPVQADETSKPPAPNPGEPSLPKAPDPAK